MSTIYVESALKLARERLVPFEQKYSVCPRNILFPRWPLKT